VCDLNTKARTGQGDSLGGGQSAGKCTLILVGVESEASVSDAAMALDIRHLHHNKSGSGHGEHGKVLEVPVGGAAIMSRVLTHWRNSDAVRDVHRTNIEGRE
jgi:hypothetical protein